MILKFKIITKIFIILFLFLLIIFSLAKIISRESDNRKNEELINEINEIVIIDNVNNDSKVEIINQTDDYSRNDPYWDYIKFNLINVNFEKLKKLNTDTVGWLNIPGTNINYPFVQTNDNSFYLNHTFNKEYNSAGWVFLDYRNNINNFDKNTIIYAHSRLDKTMFGSLANTLKKEWLYNTDNHIVKISTEIENTLWQVFSIYHIPTNNDYTKINFDNSTDFLEFIDIITQRSYYNFNTKINENDKIITISTCYNNYEKLVLHAKLIKKETR